MARYQVLVPSFIDNVLRDAGSIVDINDDPAQGGMRPGSNLTRVDAEGELEASKPARKSKKTAPEGDGDLA